MQNRAGGVKGGAMAWAMEALVILGVRHRASEMRADRTSHRESLLPVAKDKNLFFDEIRWSAIRKISGSAYLECLRRLIKNIRFQKPEQRSQSDSSRRCQGGHTNRSPTEKSSSIHTCFPYSKISIVCSSRASMVMALAGHRLAQRPQRMHFSSFLIMAPACPALSPLAGTP